MKSLFSKYRHIVTNFSSLSIIQLVGLMVPLVTLPYLIKVLGQDKYGLVVFSQAVISYFVVFINFGFNITATKDIAINRLNAKKVSEIVSSVLFIKGLLFLISCFILAILLIFFFDKNSDSLLFIFTMYLCFYEWIFPVWYFQGVERMKYISILNLISRGLFVSLIFVFIKEPSDYLKVPLINGVGALIAGSISLYIVFIKDRVRLVWCKDCFYSCFIDSIPIFGARFVAFFKDKSNIVFAGMFLTLKDVTYYDVVSKIVNIILSVFYNLSTAIYPDFSRTKNLRMVKRLAIVVVLSGVMIFAFLMVFRHRIFGTIGDFEPLAILKVLLPLGGLLVFSPISSLIGMVINAYKLNQGYFYNMLLSSAVYAGLILLLYLLDSITLLSLSASLLFSVFIELLHRVYIVKIFNK